MNNLLNHLHHYGLKQVAPERYLSRCPSHDDKSPSLTVTLQPGDKTLIHCFAGCSPEDILGSLGLTMSDLFPDDDNFDREKYQQKKQKQFLRSQFMSDYVLIQLGEAWLKNKKKFTSHDRKVFKEAIDRVNAYKFDAHKVYSDLIRQEALEQSVNRAYALWKNKTFEEKYGVSL